MLSTNCFKGLSLFVITISTILKKIILVQVINVINKVFIGRVQQVGNLPSLDERNIEQGPVCGVNLFHFRDCEIFF